MVTIRILGLPKTYTDPVSNCIPLKDLVKSDQQYLVNVISEGVQQINNYYCSRRPTSLMDEPFICIYDTHLYFHGFLPEWVVGGEHGQFRVDMDTPMLDN